jgi:hypothetical protein
MKALSEFLIRPFKERETIGGYVVWIILIAIATYSEGLRGFLLSIGCWYSWLNLKSWWKSQNK